MAAELLSTISPSKEYGGIGGSSILREVRQLLSDMNVDAFILSTGDAHQSEYVCAQDRLLEFVSQFTGSSATVVITLTEALLWTDGRYFLQAEQELSSDWTLMRMLEPGVPEVQDWLAGCATIASLGADANLVSAARAASLQKAIHPKRLCALPENPVVKVWGDRRPVAPCNPVNIHPLIYAGVSHIDKVHNIQTLLHAAGAYGLLVTMLDEIAWLLNIRGTDIPFNPVVIAYAVVTTDGAHVFLDRNKLSSDVITHLEEAVLIHSYKDIEVFLLSASSRGKIWADDTQLSWRLGGLLESSLLRRPSPIQFLKSIKNEAELRGIREAHLRDGAALTAFIAWLNAAVKSGNVVTEYDVALKVEEFRGRLLETHRGPSFETIAGYGANGAVIHYKPKASGSTELGKDSLFLLDSGAQYIDGTTDVTRTLHFGEPTPWQKTCFTLVLKGHIALARLVFPEGIPGSRFDCVSRAPLWQHGLDYNHGTGHGVGAYLNVHEGPQGIGFRRRENESGFFPGMTVSNEPGYYEGGNFGIRIETVCITKSHTFPITEQPPSKPFCSLETVTLVPIQTSLIDRHLLDESELLWLNEYHSRIRRELTPIMKRLFPEAMDFLLQSTELI